MTSSWGLIEAVDERTLGSNLVSAVSASDTVLPLESVLDFTEGMTVAVVLAEGTATEETGTIAEVDLDASTITLAAGLASGYAADDKVLISPTKRERKAHFRIGNTPEGMVLARVRHALWPLVRDGVRAPEDREEGYVSRDVYGWVLDDLVRREPVVDPHYLDPAAMAELFPQGGIEVVSSLPALPDAAYPADAFVFLNTVDGANGVGLYRSTGSAWTDDGVLDKLEVSRLTAGTLNAAIVLASTFVTATSGARIEIDGPNNRIRIYDSGDVLRFDGGASGLTVNGTLKAQNTDGDGITMSPASKNAIHFVQASGIPRTAEITTSGASINVTAGTASGEPGAKLTVEGSQGRVSLFSPTGFSDPPFLDMGERSVATNVLVNRLHIYVKDNGGISALYFKDDAGVERQVVGYRSGHQEFVEISTPATPAANRLRLYAKDKSGTSALYFKDDAGTEFDLSAAGHAEDHGHTPHTWQKVVRKSVDEPLATSTTLQNDDHLTFAIGANEVWTARYYLRLNSPAAADFKFDFTVPSGATGGWFAPGETGTAPDLETAFGTSRQFHTVGSDEVLEIVVVVATGGTAGSVALRWAQFASSGTTTVYANSFLTATRLA